ncbi:FUSC family protein [Bradyrhizobium retamae]|uniref:Fusaric acid resistance protein n=1 Tax=Bradyrhizobium retamae TaxID=1300035 RepID=A0A0R3MX23_9BRAD|nr:FUSC family protein [Bradyrhizobium retamae]KRR22581.1 hypothetical protein CQ13_28655 [Bradyrhizobium retamae]
MPVNTTSAAAGSRPLVFAGFPGSSWAFALRVWLATLLALYVSFWLELESPYSAALTVGIVALPTRAQGIEKAAYRLLATATGVVASIAIAGIFSQAGGLLLAVFSVWIGLCVYVAGMLDGNRAYAAILSCTTVALIVIEQIDSPLLVFPTGVARGAAIAIGVLAVAVVNELLSAPDYHPVLASRLEALHRRVTEFAQGVLRCEDASETAAANMLSDIAALHPEIASLTIESISGTARTAAARSAMVDLVGELTLARWLAALPPVSTTERNDRDHDVSGVTTICRTFLMSQIIRRNQDVRDSLEALRDGTHPHRRWRAPLYRSRRLAAEGAVRAAIHFMLIAFIFVIAGWPTTELCLALAAVIIGLSATAQDPRTFTTQAVFAMPIACLLGGILRYLVFNGVSEFQLLAIGLAPIVICLALLMTMPSRVLSSLGRLILVFTIAVLAPGNPQSYDPEVFVVTCLFVQLSSVLVFAAQMLLAPLSGDRRIRLLLAEANRELSRFNARRARQLAPEEAAFRDAARLEQIMMTSGGSAATDRIVAEAMRRFDQAMALRRCCAELDRLAEGPLAASVRAARAALALRDGSAILTTAEVLRQLAAQSNQSADPVIAALVLASLAFGPSQILLVSSRGKQP